MNEALLELLRADVALDAWERNPARHAVPVGDPWLVFADSLIDDGDPRGDLSRLEMRWRATGDRRFAMRRDQLLEREDDWVPGFRPHEHLRWGERWYAGHLGHVVVGATGLARLEQALENPQGRLLASLTAMVDPRDGGSGNVSDVLDGLVAMARQSRLLGLGIHRAVLQHRHLARLVELPELRGLLAIDLCVDEYGLWVLSNSPWRPRRVRLDLLVPEPTTLPDLSWLARTERLDLSGDVHPRWLSSIATSSHVGRLEELRAPVLGDRSTLQTLVAGFARLQRLHLNLGPRIWPMNSIEPAPPSRHTETLDLTLDGEMDADRTGLNAEELERLAVSRLRRLVIASCELWPGALAALRGADNLEELELTGIGVTANDLGDLVSADLPRLRRLVLSANPIGSAGMQMLAAWPGAASLRELVLRDVGMDEAGLRAIVGSPSLADLDVLDVGMVPGDVLTRVLATSITLRPQALGLHAWDVGVPWLDGLAAMLTSPVASRIRRLILPTYRLDARLLQLISAHLPDLEYLEIVPTWQSIPDELRLHFADLTRSLRRLRDIEGVPSEWWQTAGPQGEARYDP